MGRLEIVPFTEEHLGDAARLLAGRHRGQRAVEPLLSPRFEQVDGALEVVTGAWRSPDASGSVAFHQGMAVGYLLGAPKDASWGPNLWVESAGHAADEPETVRALYAAAASRWVGEGRTAHYALVPAHDQAMVGAWFRLAFGHQHTHALRTPTTDVPPPPAHLVVRRAERRDIPALGRLDTELPLHHSLSPVFSSMPLDDLDAQVADWTENFDDPAFTTFVAEHEGRVVGSAVACDLTQSSMHTGVAGPDRAGFLGFAAVLPDARGLGAGRVLGDTVTAWAAEEGYPAVVTDWRETNLTSSRTWRSSGYRDTFVRVHRVVGY